jgi:glucose/arabinose dehydrogenase
MPVLSGNRRGWLTVAALLLAAHPAFAQLSSTTYVSSLTNPVGFVQDPSNPSLQYVIQQGGIIRVVQNGSLLPTPFVNLSTAIASGGERGLLGLAFPPNYGSSGRFYVCFTNPAGHIVVARLRRSSSNPLVWDGSRFDFFWPGGQRFIFHPHSNHNGGNIAFGPDGYLYIGMGDGGGANDPDHLAQDPASLLGKMLRIDVSVTDGDVEGYDIPINNPFLGQPGYLPEIWSFGLRNPWRWSFDDPSLGGTGAMVIGDVGQNAREEIDYEPAGRGGRNYGWRNREGTLDTIILPFRPPAFGPLTDPIFEYGRTTGASVTGGVLYRGNALGANYRGRYFFADFITGRVWSIALTIAPGTGEAIASDFVEHTGELGGTASIGNIASFGVDAAGEMYLASFNGTIIKIVPGVRTPAPFMFIDTPATGAVVRQPFVIAGWALDAAAASGTGIATIHVWAFGPGGTPPGARFLGGAALGGARPDVGAFFGPQFTPSGFGLIVSGLPPGTYLLTAYAWVAAAGGFTLVRSANVTVASSTLLAVERPIDNSTVTRPFLVAGWSFDPSAPAGTGVDTLHVWAFPSGGGAPSFVGVPIYGVLRPDVGAFVGNSRFTPTGYHMAVSSLPPGTYDLVIFSHSAVTNSFDAAQAVRVTVQ